MENAKKQKKSKKLLTNREVSDIMYKKFTKNFKNKVEFPFSPYHIGAYG